MQLGERVSEIVLRIVSETSGLEHDIQPDDQILTEGILDSFGVLQLFLALQSELGADIDIEDITEESFSSISNITKLVEQRTLSTSIS